MTRYVKTASAYLIFSGGVLAVTLLVALPLATIRSLYVGDMVTRPGYRMAGTADVLGCEKVGPITTDGIGMWWNCNIAVVLADGRAVQTTVRVSTVTPGDRGTRVDIVEFCRHPRHQECTYARRGNLALTLAAGAVQILKIAILVCGFGLSATALLVGLFGRRRKPMLRRGKVPGESDESRDNSPMSIEAARPTQVGDAAEGTVSLPDIPPGFGEFVITFSYPAGARVLYQATKPMLHVDDALPTIEPSWGECRIVVAAGKRICEVWVPFEGLRFGYVKRKISVSDGTRTSLHYEAPRTPGAPGSLE